MSDNYQLKFTLLNLDESLTKIQQFNKALMDLESRGVLSGSQKQLATVVKQFENAARQTRELTQSVVSLSTGLEDGYKKATQTKKALGGVASEAQNAAKKLRNALKNLDYSELKKSVKELRTGADMSIGKMDALEKRLARFNKAAKEVDSPEVRKAFADMFGTSAARDLNKINSLMKEGNSLIRQRKRDLEVQAQGKMISQAEAMDERRAKALEAANRKRGLEQLKAFEMDLKMAQAKEASERKLALQQLQAAEMDKKLQKEKENSERKLALQQTQATEIDRKLREEKEKGIRKLGLQQLQAAEMDKSLTRQKEEAERKRALQQIQAEKMYQNEVRKTGILQLRAAEEDIKRALSGANQSERTLNAEDRYLRMLKPLSSAVELEKARTASLNATLTKLKDIQNAYNSMSALSGGAYSRQEAKFLARFGESALSDAKQGAIQRNIDTVSSTLSNRIDSSLMSAQKAEELNRALERTKSVSSGVHQVWRGMAAASGNIWLSWGNFLPMLAGLASAGSVLKSLSIERKLGWQMEMVGVAADTGAENVAKLRDQVLQLGTSGIIQGPMQLASALRVLTQAGLKTQEAFAALQTVTNLALVAEVSDEQAAQFMAGARSAFNLNDENGNLDADKFREAADQTAKAAAVSQTSIEKMMEALKQGSSEAEKFNLSIADTSVVLASLARYNIEGSAAGTALKNFLTDIAGRTPKARKALSELGLTIYTASGEMKPFTQIIQEFQAAFAGMSSQDKQHWLRRIFNERGMRTANVLLSMTNAEFNELHAQISRAGENMGYTTTSASRLANTSEGAFQKMKNGWEGMMAVVGGRLQDQFIGFMDKLTSLSRDPSVRTGIESLGKAFLTVAESLATAGAFMARFTPQVGALGAMFASLALPGLIKWVATATGIVPVMTSLIGVFKGFTATAVTTSAALAATDAAAKGTGASLASAFLPVTIAATVGYLAYQMLKVEEQTLSFKDTLQSLPKDLAAVKVDLYEAFNSKDGVGGKTDRALGIGIDVDYLKAVKAELPKFLLESARTADQFQANIGRINAAISESFSETYKGATEQGRVSTLEMIQQRVMAKERHISLLTEEMRKFDAHIKGKKDISQEERDVRMRFETEIFNHSVELMNQRTELVRAQLRQIKAEAAASAGALDIVLGTFGQGSQKDNYAGGESLRMFLATGGKAWNNKQFTREQMEAAKAAYDQDFSSPEKGLFNFGEHRKLMSAFAKSNKQNFSSNEFNPRTFMETVQKGDEKFMANFTDTVKGNLHTNPTKMRLMLEDSRRYLDTNPDKLSSDQLELLRRGYNKASLAVSNIEGEVRDSLRKDIKAPQTRPTDPSGVQESAGSSDPYSDADRNVSTNVSYRPVYKSKAEEFEKKYWQERTKELKASFEEQGNIFGTYSDEAISRYLEAMDQETKAVITDRQNNYYEALSEVSRRIASGDYVGEELNRLLADQSKLKEMYLQELPKGEHLLASYVEVIDTKIKDINGALEEATDNVASVPGGKQLSGNYGNSRKGLTLKSNEAVAGGKTSGGVWALAQVINQMRPGRVFTAFNDSYHKGKKSKHNQGLAGDVRWREGGADAEAFIAQLDKVLAGYGLQKGVHYSAKFEGAGQVNKNGTVSTGQHIHFQAMSAQAAAYIEKALTGAGPAITQAVSQGFARGATQTSKSPSGKKGENQSTTTSFDLHGKNLEDGKVYAELLAKANKEQQKLLSSAQAAQILQGKLIEEEGEVVSWRASLFQEQEQKRERGKIDFNTLNSAGLVFNQKAEEIEHDNSLADLYNEKVIKLLELRKQHGLTAGQVAAAEQQITFEYENQVYQLQRQQEVTNYLRNAQGGVQKGLATIMNQSVTWGDVTEQAVTGAFDGINNALGELVTTGKTSFREMTVSILSDLSKLLMKMALIEGMKASLGAMSGSGTGWVSMIGQLGMAALGGAVGGAAGGAASGAASGMDISNLFAKGGAFRGGVKYFANGGTFTNSVVDRPTPFKFGGALGVMGEAGPEAILPLTRTSSGNLGVEASGFGGGGGQVINNISVSIQMNSDGSSKEQTNASTTNDGRQVSNMVVAKIKEVLTQEARPGGIIYNSGRR